MKTNLNIDAALDISDRDALYRAMGESQQMAAEANRAPVAQQPDS
jgi:hypothetical protein